MNTAPKMNIVQANNLFLALGHAQHAKEGNLENACMCIHFATLATPEAASIVIRASRGKGFTWAEENLQALRVRDSKK